MHLLVHILLADVYTVPTLERERGGGWGVRVGGLRTIKQEADGRPGTSSALTISA